MKPERGNNGRVVQLGFIGAGSHATSRLYPVLHRLPVQLRAVCDLDGERARRTAVEFGAKSVYENYNKMIEQEDLDAVIVCINARAHAELAEELLSRGLHVFTEKPPAPSSAAALRVLEASRRSGRIAMAGFKKRFCPAYVKARSEVTSPGFGQPSMLSFVYGCGPEPYEHDPEFFLLDFCVHGIDLVRFLFGEIVEVSARKGPGPTYVAALTFANGAVGTLAFSGRRSWSLSTEIVELTGNGGETISVRDSIEYERRSDGRVIDSHRPVFSTTAGDSLIETGFVGELDAFCDAIIDGTDHEVGALNSYRTMLVHDAIRESSSNGQKVSIANIEPVSSV
jgi:UDP-N-acetylglucosamine 3-dehydrogenase